MPSGEACVLTSNATSRTETDSEINLTQHFYYRVIELDTGAFASAALGQKSKELVTCVTQHRKPQVCSETLPSP